MVRIVVLFYILTACVCAKAQSDTLKCKETFVYFDTLLGENLIVIWETPPTLRKCSQKNVYKLKEFVKEQVNYEYILVDMMGTPKNYLFFKY